MSTLKPPKIEQLALSALTPYARNSRTHSDAQIDKIAKAITEFGFLVPVVVDAEGGILAGHARVMAAIKLGLKSVPCIRAAHLTEAQQRAFVIADNRIAEDSGWDYAMLQEEIVALEDAQFDLSALGFELPELGNIMAENTYQPPEVQPGVAGRSQTAPENFDAADTVLRIGSYRVGIRREAFLRWEESMKQQHGFNARDVTNALLRSLGFNPETDTLGAQDVGSRNRRAVQS